MTDGSNGASEGAGGTGQDDDPFGYLYRPAEGESAQERSPRNSYARPMEVGRAQYGQQHQQAPQYQQPRRPGPGPGAEATTQLPQQQSRYAERSRPAPGEDAPRGRGKGPVIGVVAVVAAIAIGSGIALSGNDGKSGKDTAGAAPATSAGHSASSSPSASASGSPSASAGAGSGSNSLVDASKAQAQSAPAGNAVKGAISADGSYLTLQPGSSATWTVTVPAAGGYKLWVHYNNNADPAKASVAINGTDRAGGITFRSWAKGSDQSQAWSYTWILPTLQAGSNTITVSSPAGGPVLIDQIAVTGTDVSGNYPSAAAAPTS